jgi:hypothetical protein
MLNIIEKKKEELNQLREKKFIDKLQNSFNPLFTNVNNSFKELSKIFNSKFEGQGNQIKEVKKDTETIQNIVNEVIKRIDNIKIIKGDKGDKGNDLIFESLTEEQKKKIIENILSLIPSPKNGIDGKNGQDGITPLKGIDYFTIEDIQLITENVLTNIPKYETAQITSNKNDNNIVELYDIKKIINDLKKEKFFDKLIKKYDLGSGSSGIQDAPKDGIQYARQDGTWVEVGGGDVSNKMDIDGLNSNITYLNFDPTTAPTYQQGRVWYDNNSRALSYYDEHSGTSIQVGKELILDVRNNTGSTVLNGKAVYVSGATGQHPTIAFARANSETTSELIGIATHDIVNNSVGKITIIGIVSDVDTSAYNDGDALYLSASVAGDLTDTIPSSPNYTVPIGYVTYAHATQGQILVYTSHSVSNNNSLGTSQHVSVTENAVKTYVDTELSTKEDTSNKGIANGYASLDSNGKLSSAEIPSITITDTYVVGSQAAMLALSAAEQGDVAVRTDLNKSFILVADPYSVLANWQELLSPTDAVSSVFGRSGTVTAQSDDYTATQITNTPSGSIAAINVQTALNELDTEKQATITGAATTITSSNLTASRLVESNASGKVAVSGIIIDTQDAITQTVANSSTSSKTAINTTVTQSVASGSGFYRGGLIQIEASHSSGTVNNITGIASVVRNTGAGTTTEGNGFQVTVNPTGGTMTTANSMKATATVGNASATVGELNGYLVDTPVNSGTITNTNGLRIKTQVATGAGTQTNTPYAIKQEGATDKVDLAGVVTANNTSNSISVADDAYGVGWNGSNSVPTKNAIYDKIETLTPYTDEQAQDAIGTILINTDTVNLTYDDGTPDISADVRTQMSITSDGSGIKLSGDETSPGNSEYYGTDSGGTKGFFALPSAQAIDIQSYTTNSGSPFTWNKPAGVSVVEVICIGSGGGGGGGSSIAAATLKTGGAGGGGGSIVTKTFKASDLSDPVSVTVGAGGVGGTGGTNANGGVGNNGNSSSFGSYLIAYGGGGGSQGTSTGTRTGGSGAGTAAVGIQGAAANTLGGAPATTANVAGISGQGAGAGTGVLGKSAEYGGGSGAGTTSAGAQGVGGSSLWGAAGGGAGGSYDAANANSRVPTAGGNVGTYTVGGGGAAGTNGGAPTAGTAGTNGDSTKCGKGGGGGGAGLAVPGANGGAGGSHGGGGGGGGAASGITNKGGNGGNGGDGAVYVISY